MQRPNGTSFPMLRCAPWSCSRSPAENLKSFCEASWTIPIAQLVPAFFRLMIPLAASRLTTPSLLMLMFIMSEADAELRAALAQGGEFSAAIEMLPMVGLFVLLSYA